MIRPVCHPSGLHYAKGLCNKCYFKQYYETHPKKKRLSKAKAKYVPDIQYILNNWESRLDDPGVIVNIVRGVFTAKSTKGLYSA